MNLFEFFRGNYLVGAPLAGITNYPFRKIVRKYHSGLIFTEMVSVEGLKRGNKKSVKLIDIHPDERNVGIQLFGGEPESYIGAVKFLNDNYSPFCIDINIGCPVKKVLKSKAGAYLLTDLKRLESIVKTAVKNSRFPVSVKTRVGWDDKNHVYKEVLKICEGEGVSFITIHGRTKSQMYGCKVGYNSIAEMKSLARVPVIGNGDVVDLESFELMKRTGVDGIMIGRGMMKSPWIFDAITKGFDPVGYLSGNEIVGLLDEFLQEWKLFRNSERYLEAFKKFVVWFSKGYRNSAEFRNRIYSELDESELMKEYRYFYTK
ncbi:MAG: tRNA-dihydrouridine synthase family protein [Calditerrivibrio sp.]|nr:tRNA-dihydrouridine synthase family protein [Calditerrivibrio sp.]MCA1980519.1 tRNA-dihydrouridine synthase family protein [Calditerrivibrio sp.]